MQCCTLVWNFKNIIELKILLWALYCKKQKGTKIGWRGSLVEPSQVYSPTVVRMFMAWENRDRKIAKLIYFQAIKDINKPLLYCQCSSFRKNSMGKLFLLQCYQVNCWKLSNYGGFIFNVYQLKLVSFQTCHPSQYLKTNINNRIINKFYNRFFGNKDK